jgi:hypothetical protein
MNQRNSDKDITKKGVGLSSVVNVPGKPYEVLAVGNDRMITSNAPTKKGQKDSTEIPSVLS